MIVTPPRTLSPGFTNTSFERNTVRPQHPLPLYDKARAGLDAYFRKLAAVGDSAELVAEVVVKAALDKTPKVRYPAGKIAHQISALRRFVPAFLFDRMLRKRMSLPR